MNRNYQLMRVGLTILTVCVGIFAIIWVNYQIIGNWFGKNGPANLGSIEVSYVSMGRFLTEFGFPFPGGSSWSPFWYFGFPFHLFYTPLLPFLEAFLHKAFSVPLWESYRLLTGLSYILGPVSVFFLGWQLSKRVIGGIIAAAFYSVGPTILYFLDPGVAADRFSPPAGGFLDPRRFTILVRWGEGPHVFSLIFIPLVGLFFAKVLETMRFRWIVLTSLFLGLAGLTNAIGLFASILLIASMTFVKFSQEERIRRKTIRLAFLVGLMALGFISFWYNLSFIRNFFGEGEGTGKMYLDLFPWGWVGFILVLGALFFLFNKVIRNFPIAFSLLWFSIFFIVVEMHYSHSIDLLPQALRYNTEVDLSLSVLLGVMAAKLIDYLPKRANADVLVEFFLGIVVVVSMVLYVQPFIPVARNATGGIVELNTTSEYRIASWLSSHVDEKKGERVFLPGNYGFYLNYFTNVWQHRGALFQAATHHWPDHMHYQMATGTDPKIARAWLIAANTKYAVITTPQSREIYHEIKNPYRFEDFSVAYNNDGDIIYEIPLKRPSLAKPVNLSTINSLVAPKKGDDKHALLPYADWVENSSHNQTSLVVVNNDTYQITGEVGQGEGILVQMTADSGWSALRLRQSADPQGKLVSVKTGSDPMGFLILYPEPGSVDISLTHGTTWKEWLGYFITISTLIGIVLYGVLPRKHTAVSQQTPIPT